MKKTRKTYAIQEKLEIVSFCEKYGIKNTIRKYETSEQNVYLWKRLHSQNKLANQGKKLKNIDVGNLTLNEIISKSNKLEELIKQLAFLTQKEIK